MWKFYHKIKDKSTQINMLFVTRRRINHYRHHLQFSHVHKPSWFRLLSLIWNVVLFQRKCLLWKNCVSFVWNSLIFNNSFFPLFLKSFTSIIYSDYSVSLFIKWNLTWDGNVLKSANLCCCTMKSYRLSYWIYEHASSTLRAEKLANLLLLQFTNKTTF